MSTSPKTGRFKLARASGGRCFYTGVSVEAIPCEATEGTEVAWQPDAFEPIECAGEEFRRGVARGISIALGMFHEPAIRIEVSKIRVTLVDSREDAVAFATCFAVWDALKVCSCAPPRLENGSFLFPRSR